MSKLKEKSNFNIQAAESLEGQSLYAPSIHCAYYSCCQLLKYTINEFCGIDYQQQAIEISSSKQQSHQYVVNYITNELKKYVDFQVCRDFKRKIKDLKQFRIESDYENIEINTDKSQQAIGLAKEIRMYVIRNFNI